MTNAIQLLAALAIQVGPASQVVVPAGDRIEVNINPRGGAIVVEASERSDVQVTGWHSDVMRLEINEGATVEIHEVRPMRAGLERTEYRILVPVQTSVTVVSDEADVVVRGVHGDVSVNVNHGRAEAHDVRGNVSLDSSSGDLLLESSVGRALLDSGPGTVTVRRFEGPVEVETVAGAVSLADLSSSSVRVTTSAGTIDYSGPLSDDAVLDLATQRGDVTLRLPPETSASFDVGTVGGQFETTFDLGGVTPVQGESFTFMVGSSRARVAIITYSGAIRIVGSSR
jgi:DUF4097 and DUF4098 domain-containing protein YvlB